MYAVAWQDSVLYQLILTIGLIRFVVQLFWILMFREVDLGPQAIRGTLMPYTSVAPDFFPNVLERRGGMDLKDLIFGDISAQRSKHMVKVTLDLLTCCSHFSRFHNSFHVLGKINLTFHFLFTFF